MKNSVEKGAGLLEIVLVLVVAAVIIIMSLRFYNSYIKTRDIGLFQTSVSQLMNALNNYYFMHCRTASDDFANVTIQKLKDAELLSSKFNNHHAWGDFLVSIKNFNKTGDHKKDFYVLKVTANLTTNTNVKLPDYLRSALNGDNGTGNIVEWTRLPLHSTDDLSSHQWMLNQGQGQMLMPGRYTTAVNAGMGSKFWILNSSLQAFTKEATKNEGYTACPN
jgi:Tfp pilus assembly protein PilE